MSNQLSIGYWLRLTLVGALSGVFVSALWIASFGATKMESYAILGVFWLLWGNQGKDLTWGALALQVIVATATVCLFGIVVHDLLSISSVLGQLVAAAFGGAMISVVCIRAGRMLRGRNDCRL